MRVCSALKDEEEKILYPPPQTLTGPPIAAFSCVSGTHESVAGTKLQQQRQQQERKLDSMLPPVWLPALSVWLAGCPADEQGERGAPTREREGVEKEVGRTDNWSDTQESLRNLTQQESGGGCPHGIKATCIAGTTNERLLAHALPSCCPGAQSLALLLLMHWC